MRSLSTKKGKAKPCQVTIADENHRFVHAPKGWLFLGRSFMGELPPKYKSIEMVRDDWEEEAH